jgi:hypothetical protein
LTADRTRPRARERYSSNAARTHRANASGSGICSRHDVGEIINLSS